MEVSNRKKWVDKNIQEKVGCSYRNGHKWIRVENNVENAISTYKSS
jgi:hypothetical protein